MSRWPVLFALVWVSLLAACGGEASVSITPDDVAVATASSTPMAAVTIAVLPTVTEQAVTVVVPTVIVERDVDEADVVVVETGRLPDNSHYIGSPDAPITLIDYSDFLCTNCLAYVTRTEPLLINNYVKSGQLKIIFWPVVAFGFGSLNAHAAADCVGQQSAEAFWAIHGLLFENQDDIWNYDGAAFSVLAEQAGADPALFIDCFEGGAGHGNISSMDSIRQERGIFDQPVFDINGQIIFGQQSFDVFAPLIEAKLP